jgi:hypothetical protein
LKQFSRSLSWHVIGDCRMIRASTRRFAMRLSDLKRLVAPVTLPKPVVVPAPIAVLAS